MTDSWNQDCDNFGIKKVYLKNFKRSPGSSRVCQLDSHGGSNGGEEYRDDPPKKKYTMANTYRDKN